MGMMTGRCGNGFTCGPADGDDGLLVCLSAVFSDTGGAGCIINGLKTLGAVCPWADVAISNPEIAAEPANEIRIFMPIAPETPRENEARNFALRNSQKPDGCAVLQLQ